MNSSKNSDKTPAKKPLAHFFAEAAFGTGFTYLTSGVFLTGLAIYMGAGDVLVSFLSVVVNICGVLILFFAGFLEHFKSRKRLTVALTVLSRLATLFIVAIPALVPKELQLILFVVVVIAAFTLQAQTTVVLNQWMMAFVDEKKSGRSISFRQTLVLIVTVLLSVTSGRFLDIMGRQYIGFVLLFAFAGLMGLIEVVLLVRTPDSPAYVSQTADFKMRELAKLPLQNKRFTGFVIYILCFYLLLYIGDSFTTVYMIKYLALPYQTVTMLFMIISLPQVLLLGIWGKISDRKGHEFVLKTSIWLFAGETLFMSFTNSGNWYLFIPAAFMIASAANAGFVISVFNRRYELMPKENRIIYDNFYTAVIGVGFLLGPATGGVIKSLLESNTELMSVMEFANIRLLYLISTAGILLLQLTYLYFHRNRKENEHVSN